MPKISVHGEFFLLSSSSSFFFILFFLYFKFFLREVFLWVGIDDVVVAFGRFGESLCIISIKVCKFCFKELHIELPLYQSKLYRILVLSVFLDQLSTDPQSIEPYISTSVQDFLDQLKDRRCNKAHCSIVSSLHLFLDHFISIFLRINISLVTNPEQILATVWVNQSRINISYLFLDRLKVIF